MRILHIHGPSIVWGEISKTLLETTATFEFVISIGVDLVSVTMNRTNSKRQQHDCLDSSFDAMVMNDLAESPFTMTDTRPAFSKAGTFEITDGVLCGAENDIMRLSSDMSVRISAQRRRAYV